MKRDRRSDPIRADFDLRSFFERLARTKGANKAKVATARRLLTIIYKVWKDGRNYMAYRLSVFDPILPGQLDGRRQNF
jgi:hypothetical protein